MNLRFVGLKAILLDAEAINRIVTLDGCMYWPKRKSNCWYLEGRKCDDQIIYDEDFDNGGVYQKFETVDYYG